MAGQSSSTARSQSQAAPDKHGDLTGLLNALVENTDGDTTTIGQLLDAFGTRTFGPLMLLPAIIAVAPTGAIPGMSIVTGTIILLISMQILIGRGHVWLPERVTTFSLSRDKLKESVGQAVPWANWLQNYVGRRWTLLADPPAHYLVAATCAALALTMFPLALVPFGVAIPGSAVALFALGLTLKDGALIVAGYILTVASAYAVYSFF